MPASHNIHRDVLNPIAREVGELLLSSLSASSTPRLRTRVTGYHLRPLPEKKINKYSRRVRSDHLEHFSKSLTRPNLDKKDFDRVHRRLWSHQDEIISTSTTRELIVGARTSFNKLPLKKTKREITVDIFSAVMLQLSSLRVPTRFVGISMKAEDGTLTKWNHPTSGKGLFSRRTRGHTRADTERKAYILEKMRKSKPAFRQLSKAGRLAAIIFTLSKMMAPVTASNVHPHSDVNKLSKESALLTAQTQAREILKRLYVIRGGKIDLGEPDKIRSPYRYFAFGESLKEGQVTPPRDRFFLETKSASVNPTELRNALNKIIKGKDTVENSLQRVVSNRPVKITKSLLEIERQKWQEYSKLSGPSQEQLEEILIQALASLADFVAAM